MKLVYGSKSHLYEQIEDMVKNMIISGVLQNNERIPSVRELALTLAINPNTIQKAYKELESQGYIYSLKTKGYFVSPLETFDNSGKKELLTEQLKTTLRELYFLGVKKQNLFDVIDKIYSGGDSK